MRRFATVCALFFFLCPACSGVRVFAADAEGGAGGGDRAEIDLDSLLERIARWDRRIGTLDDELAALERRAGEEADSRRFRDNPERLATDGNGLLHSLFLRIDDELARMLGRTGPDDCPERPESRDRNRDPGDAMGD